MNYNRNIYDKLMEDESNENKLRYTQLNESQCKRCGGNHSFRCHIIQNYGEQHPEFHSEEMKAFRKERNTQ